MNDDISLNSLRNAIKQRKIEKEDAEKIKFENVAQRYEKAVHHLINQIHTLVQQIPEFNVELEDEKEVFTSPAFPHHSMEIEDQRLKISLDEDFILFDPTAKAITSAMGQIEIIASKPINFMIEKILYLVHDHNNPKSMFWGYRSMENLGAKLLPFTQNALLKLLHEVFAP